MPKTGKTNWIWLMAALIAVGVSLYASLSTWRLEKVADFDLMLAAAAKMEEASASVRSLRASLGIPISAEDDPNGTGLIGQELTDITTTVGNLQSKRTSTNPDFAALTVKYFSEIGLKEGDLVAVGASGSFPGIIIAVLSACRVTGVEPVLIPSIGASEYGANIPGLTSVEIIDWLNSQGVFDYVPVAISLGGAGDTGDGGIIADSKPILQDIAVKSGHRIIEPADVVDSIALRMEAFEAAGDIKAFINIGGAEPNFGSTSASLEFDNGLVTKPPVKVDSPGMGLIFEYINKGIPVIHFLDIKGLALKSGIPIDPIPMPNAGTSALYYRKEYNRAYAAAGILAAALMLAAPWILGNGREPQKKDKGLTGTRRMVLLSMLLALGVGLHALEAMIPIPIALPGAKIGIANIVTLICLYVLGPLNAILLAVARVLLGSLVTGTFGSTMFLMAMAGALGSGIVMAAFRAITSSNGKYVAACSMAGAVGHNISQLGMFMLISGTSKVFVMLPYLLTVALPTGYFTGLAGIYSFLAIRRLPGFKVRVDAVSAAYGKRSLVVTAVILMALSAATWGAILLSDRIAQNRLLAGSQATIVIKRFTTGQDRGEQVMGYPWPPGIGTTQEGQFTIDGRMGQSVLEYDDELGVRFISSPCRDKLCVKHGWVNDEMDLAACLPNGIIVSVSGGR